MASFWPWLASDLFAEVEVINGDFSEPGFVVDEQFSDFTHDIPWWGELNEEATWDDMLINTAAGALADEDFTAGLAGWRGFASGYVYQEIGTPDGAEQLRVTGVNFWRDNGQNQYDDLAVSVLSLPDGDPFVFEEFGNDILDEGDVVDTERIIPAPDSQNSDVPFDELFNLTGLTPNDRLFLRFSAGVNPDLPSRDVWAYVDVIAALNAGTYLTGPYGAIQAGPRMGTQPAVVPEPSAALLVVLGLLSLSLSGWRARRKRQAS